MVALAYPSQQTTPQTLAQSPIPPEDLGRQQDMKEAWKAYRGKFPKPLKVDKDQTDDNVIVNKCATIVDKGYSFLFGQILKIEVVENSATHPKSTLQEFLDGFWGDEDDKMTLLTKIAMNGGICGQTFVKLIPAKGKKKYPRLVNLNPMVVRIVVDSEDCDIILAFIVEYPALSGWRKRQIIARIDPEQDTSETGKYSEDDNWTITTYMRRGQTDQWIQTGEQEPWPYPFPPVFTCQNLPLSNEPWGIPDLPEEIIRQNNSLNFVQSNTNRIIKWHAHPKTWGKGFRAEALNVAVNDVLIIEAPDGQLQNLEMKSDLASSRSFAADIRTSMNEQSRVPGIALGTDEPRGNISGIALRQYYAPLIEKTTLKQRLYGRLIREVSRAALALAGLISIDEIEDFKIKLHWQSVLPTDDIAAAQEALILDQLGVSQDTIFAGLGLNADEETDKKAAETQRKMTAYSRGQGFAPTPPGQAPMPGNEQGQQPGQPMNGGQQ